LFHFGRSLLFFLNWFCFLDDMPGRCLVFIVTGFLVKVFVCHLLAKMMLSAGTCPQGGGFFFFHCLPFKKISSGFLGFFTFPAAHPWVSFPEFFFVVRWFPVFLCAPGFLTDAVPVSLSFLLMGSLLTVSP